MMPGLTRRQRLVATGPAAPPRRAPGSAPRTSAFSSDQPLQHLGGLRVLDVQRQAFLGAVGPDEVRGQAAHALVVAAREVAHAGALDLDDARAQVGQLARGEGRGDGVFERDDGDALAAAACRSSRSVAVASIVSQPSWSCAHSLHGLAVGCGAPLTRNGCRRRWAARALKRKRRHARPRAPGGAAGPAAAWRSAGRARPGPGSPRPR